MKVEIWSDFICYNSYLCRQNLLSAIDQFPYREYVDIEFKSFPLLVLKKTLTNDNKLIKNKNDQNLQAKKQLDTLLAHRLVHLAKTKEKASEFVDKVFHAYFVEKKRIDRLQIITTIAYSVGLNRTEVDNIVSTNKYKRLVELDIDEAMQMGADSPPFIVINETYAIPSAYSADEYAQLLVDIWGEIKGEPRYKNCKAKQPTSYCTGDHCE